MTNTATPRLTDRSWVTGALLLSVFMTAIEVTIVATAMPRIVAELGGFALLSWVFSAYLLTQVVFIPIYGKLADLYGRKPVFMSGLVIFLIGSVLCGLSNTMIQLIAARFLQGVGGGAVQPISVTIAGDLYPPAERHRVQGLFGSIFAVSSIAGPTLGAFIVDVGHWSWIFYVNIPLGLLALAVVWFYLHEEKQSRQRSIDYPGAALLIAGTSALMFALLQGGSAWPWLSWQTGTLLVVFSILLALLLKQEARAAEPILPLWIFRHPLISVAGIATFLNGAMMIGYSAMIPTYVQGVLGRSAMVAGLALAGMTLGWPLASFTSGKLMQRFGYRRTAILGAATVVVGSVAVLIAMPYSAFAIGAAMFFVGLGLGFQANAYIITIQSSVSWSERGVATANNLFMRTLGSAVGVAAFGGILNSAIASQLHGAMPDAAAAHGVDLVNQLLDPTGKFAHAGDRESIIAALDSGMHTVFGAAIAVACIGAVIALFLPKVVTVRTEGSPGLEDDDAIMMME